MSLILEALRKSEEQRRLGQAPDLIGADAWSTRRRYLREPRGARRWWIAGGVVVALAAGGFFVYQQRQDAGIAPVAGRDAPAEPTPPAAAPRAAGAAPTVARTVRDDAGTDASPRAQLPFASDRAAPVDPGAPPAIAGARDATRVDANPDARVAATAAPPSPDDAQARAQMPADVREKFDRGEVFANNADLLATKPPTSGTPFVPPEAALPQPLPDAANAADPAVAPTPPPQPVPTPPVAAAPPPAPAAQPASPVTATAPPPAQPALPVGQNPAVAGYEPAVPSIYELPYETRRTMPALKVAMHVYSPTPDQRFVVINDVRAGEGQPLADGLEVIEIRDDGVVIAYRGTRFLLPRNGR